MNVVQYEPELETFDDVESSELLVDAPEQSESATGRAAFDLFLLINATLFLRPSEIIPALGGVPIYELLNLICIALCFPQMMSKLSGGKLKAAPIIACVVGLQISVVLSDLSHFAFDNAFHSLIAFAKVLAYFLMLVTVVDTPQRLRTMLLWLLCCTTVLTGLALLHFHGIANIPAMEASRDQWRGENGEAGIELLRLCAAGLYGNPNDLARILTVGMILCIYWITDRNGGSVRFLWIAPFIMLGYALQLTHSRGGLLSLLAGLALLFKIRFGWFKAILAGIVVVPVLLVAFAGRQLDMDTTSGTGQERIQLWSEGLSYLRSYPLFGIGMERYQEYVGLAAHNSFVQCFVDLGFVGGTLFIGVFYLALVGSLRAGAMARDTVSGELYRLRSYMVAIVGSAIVGMFSSTRSYIIPTYTILGLAACYLHLVEKESGQPEAQLSTALCRRLVAISFASLVCIYIYIRLSAKWD